MFSSYAYTCIDRFRTYVKIDTQSDPTSTAHPSTEKQKDLSRLLVKELEALGLQEISLDEYGYVYATLPGNTTKQVPTIGLCAHVDVSPDAPSERIQPVMHPNYQGGEIVLPWDTTQCITPAENPVLNNMIGYDIITSDGTTLLGADDKAGVAEIMDALHYLVNHPEVKHGTIKICFTPDEEIGGWTDKINLNIFNPTYAYTIDGGERGSLEVETFSADKITFTFFGHNVHPGFGKDKLINALKVASHFVASLPQDIAPETTEWSQWFIHPNRIAGREDATTVEFILRDFKTPQLHEYSLLLQSLAQQACQKFPGSSFAFDQKEQYRNMREILKDHTEVKTYAEEAMRRCDIEPIVTPIRGGTDGARLSFMGIPTPNLFAGWHNFHSKKEFVAVQDMEAAVRVIVTLCQVREEKTMSN